MKRHELFAPVVDAIKAMGFRVYQRRPADAYAIVASDKGLCYVQVSHCNCGFDVSSTHKPSRNIGTGFQMYREVDEVTADMLNKAIEQTGPAFGLWEHPRKYRDIDEYRQQGPFESEYAEV